MPIPKPNSEESESEFVSRCIRKIIDEYDQSQAAAICYNTYRKKESMSKKEKIFVLQPRKSENRGKFLSRCSNNSKMKSQFPSMKERLGFCLNSFNEYYRYWNRLDFAEVPEESVLGMCIAQQKSKGFDYKEAYARCASKVVAKSGPVVLSEDNLLIEPVEFADVSIDFDDTLSTKRGQELAMKLIDEGETLHIITRRREDESKEVYEIADEIGIPREDIHFTNGKLKWELIKKLGIKKHIDNNPDEINAIKENLPDVEAVKFSY